MRLYVNIDVWTTRKPPSDSLLLLAGPDHVVILREEGVHDDVGHHLLADACSRSVALSTSVMPVGSPLILLAK